MSSEPIDAAPRLPPNTSPHLHETCDYNTDAAALVQILDEYLASLKAGNAPSRTELLARYPDFATQLEACLAGLEFLHGVDHAPTAQPQRLGDFQIVREVGRGGMGAVFEAEQISLGRRVALKILRFGGVSDPEAIERFQREAETIAKLHHTNIVPVFAVGSERGVNYYAMQFIEGQSLAEVFAARNGSLGSDQVAQWGLQAAEALSHAHQRGVIHRDVKPSNLLLDKEGRLWLTDFGLARRAGDVTLSLTGALLGTPRYMSPEQATATHKKVDHRSDIFSLGTTLYELLSGQPAFLGNTAHDVIQHILSADPTPLRQLAPSIPRDLETIVHKCLAKDPQRRYNSAQDLAEDLRAFLDGRPIRARRFSIMEQATNWLKHQQRSVKLAGFAVATTLLAIVVGVTAWSSYLTWQQSSLKLLTPTPPLVAEILSSSGKSLRVETLPTQQAITLPSGNYQIRASQEGTLSETWDLPLERGKQASPSIDLRDQALVAPLEIDRSFALANLGETSGIVLLNKTGIGLHSTNMFKAGWTAELTAKSSPLLEKYPGFRWEWNTGSDSYSGYETHDLRPWVIEQSFDINGDGTKDLILAARHQSWLMTLSGTDGQILWFEGRAKALEVAPAPGAAYYDSTHGVSAALHRPIVIPDCDGDNIPDLITSFVEVDVQRGSNTSTLPNRQWAEAFSGKTGKSLWEYEIPSHCFDVPLGNDIPLEMRWHFLSPIGMTNQGGGNFLAGSRHRLQQTRSVMRAGNYVYGHDMQLVSHGGIPQVAIIAGKTLISLKPQDGTPLAEPIDLGIRCGRVPQWADCDSDSMPELVALEPVLFTGTSIPLPKLVVWSSAKRSVLWQKTLSANWPYVPDWSIPSPKWPLITDLDGDGRVEILAPDGQALPKALGWISSSSTPWGALKLFEGKTGSERWSRRFPSMDCQLNHFITGPDLNQDGMREIFVASFLGRDCEIFVDSLDGKTGATLWSNNHLLEASNAFNARIDLLPLAWWQGSSGTSAQLLVHAVESRFGGDRMHSTLYTITAADGSITHLGKSISEAIPADLDHDGSEELLLFSSKSPNSRDWGGKLQVVRGTGEDPWNKLAALGTASSDLDGDSVRDLITTDWRGLKATSGRTGQSLWNSSLSKSFSNVQLHTLRPSSKTFAPSAVADLNGDGVDDLLATGQGNGGQLIAPFYAISGKSGNVLWNAKSVNCQTMGTVLAAEAHDLQGNEQLDVVILASLDYGYPASNSFSSHESQLWLFVLSGKDGKLRWSHPLSDAYGKTPGSWLPLPLQGFSLSLSIGDLNNDGIQDILVPSLMSSGKMLETLALNGQQGSLLWKRPVPLDNTFRNLSIAHWIPPTLGDLQGDGKADVAIVEFVPQNTQVSSPANTLQVVLLDGKSGEPQWSWKHTEDVLLSPIASAYSMADLMRPQLLHVDSKKQLLAVLISSSSQSHVLLLDSSGNPTLTNISSEAMANGLWPCDIQKDGTDEVFFIQNAALVACSTKDLANPLWSKPLHSHAIYTQVLQIDTNSPFSSSPVIAFINGATDNTVLGIDSANGNTLWTSPGPRLHDNEGNYQTLSQISLLGGKATDLPLIYCAYGSVARCRQALLTPQASNSSTSNTFTPSIARSPRTWQETRWQRDLPWIEPRGNWNSEVELVGWSLFFAATLFVIPANHLFGLLVRRQFSLRHLLLLSAVVGVFLVAAQTRLPSSSEFRTLTGRLGMGLMFSPVLLSLLQLFQAIRLLQGRRLLFWLGVILLWSIVAAAIGILMDLSQTPMLPEESYDLAGWYKISIVGIYLTCWNIFFALAIRYLVSWVKKRPPLVTVT